MSLLSRFLRRRGYIKLSDYGLALTAENRVVAMPAPPQRIGRGTLQPVNDPEAVRGWEGVPGGPAGGAIMGGPGTSPLAPAGLGPADMALDVALEGLDSLCDEGTVVSRTRGQAAGRRRAPKNRFLPAGCAPTHFGISGPDTLVTIAPGQVAPPPAQPPAVPVAQPPAVPVAQPPAVPVAQPPAVPGTPQRAPLLSRSLPIAAEPARPQHTLEGHAVPINGAVRPPVPGIYGNSARPRPTTEPPTRIEIRETRRVR